MSKEKKRNLKYINLYKNLGENIKKYRKNKGFSQEELAFNISSTRNYVGCIERAEKYPSLGFLFDVATALNIKIQDLFEFEN
ncbi:MAG: helix-turn-helix domain-containing protein [Candidatus Gastranaerophilales bacterium]|nr:helix-turn-helix domain-containing protein [Candidatus Gastranaerophilales bacterium]